MSKNTVYDINNAIFSWQKQIYVIMYQPNYWRGPQNSLRVPWPTQMFLNRKIIINKKLNVEMTSICFHGYDSIFCVLLTVNDLFSASALVTAPYLFFPAISSVAVHNIHIFFIYCTYFYLINGHFCHDFRVCFHLPPYLQEVGISKCRKTVFLLDWPILHPGKYFMMGALKGTFFPNRYWIKIDFAEHTVR